MSEQKSDPQKKKPDPGVQNSGPDAQGAGHTKIEDLSEQGDELTEEQLRQVSGGTMAKLGSAGADGPVPTPTSPAADNISDRAV
jgi:hypothetical protein